MKSSAILSLSIWLVSIIITSAQPAVLDTDGHPVITGVEYYILPAITDVAGGLRIVDRNDSCPLYVGQEPLAEIVSPGYPVKFEPFAKGEKTIREGRAITVTFQAATLCIQGTSWGVGEENLETKRRYIAVGGASYFNIGKDNDGVYSFNYCPAEVCPICRFRCGNAGIIVENKQRLLVLDGPAFPFRFRKVNDQVINEI